nr:immunoglobulin light chain junction region [Macaca mulatta]MOV65944.1 immunoglobulin light chain junction region [Macaca mulatta]MOV65952.1 immunoglobulin light chain junction region [Macaca mulatta]MOV66033.1 immunoglobulin light chain junction region [Macaca mulatta]MOV66147.1 immunoglobulin light chain junction region [Macaca mulatta]
DYYCCSYVGSNTYIF